jgi:regulator of replication initiation timing
MKNKYEIHDNYILKLENETLRERLAEIQAKLDKIEKILNGTKNKEQPS